MKCLALVLAASTLMAGAASAYIQPGQLPQTNTQTTGSQNLQSKDDQDPGRGANGPTRGTEPAPGPTNPVPEPGTLMLASMGLIALGATLRRRHH